MPDMPEQNKTGAVRVIHGAGRGASAVALLAVVVLWSVPATRVRAADPARIGELGRTLSEDQSYKVRVQAALVLGKLGDPHAVPALVKALNDENKTVRAMAAQALGSIGDMAAQEPLRSLLKREKDPFVRSHAEKALASLRPPAPAGGAAVVKHGAGAGKAKIYLNVGPFSGGVKSAGADATRILREALQHEFVKLSTVTFEPPAGDPKAFGKSGMLGFYIDGNITRLGNTPAGGSVECDVKVMVARWPSKSIILWTNAGAEVQSGNRPRDAENARKDCLEASAGQLAEDLVKFLKSQGG